MDHRISSLLSVCHQLVNTRNQLVDQLTSESLPAWLPDQASQRSVAIQAATALYADECPLPPRSGLLCVGQRSADIAAQFNLYKQILKETIRSLKEDLPPGRDNRTFHALLTQTDSPLFQRDPTVAKALRQVRFGDLHLVWAYRQLRVLDPTVLSFRWCWHVKRREVIRLKHEEVVQLAERRMKGKAREVTLSQLARENPNHDFARARTQPSPQLKANIVALHEGEKIRYSIPTPSIVLINQEALPDLRWVGNEEPASKRGGRSDATIEKEPFIPALKIYRYVD